MLGGETLRDAGVRCIERELEGDQNFLDQFHIGLELSKWDSSRDEAQRIHLRCHIACVH